MSDPPGFQSDAGDTYYSSPAFPEGIRRPPSSTPELETVQRQQKSSSSSPRSTRPHDTVASSTLELELTDDDDNERVGLMKTTTTTLFGFGNGNTKQRSSAKAFGSKSLGSSRHRTSGGGLRQITNLKSLPSAFSIRNAAILGSLAMLAFLFIDNLDGILDLEKSGPDEFAGYSSSASPHNPSFGGINNLGHPGGAKAAFEGKGLAFEEIIIPVANFGRATKSLNVENIINHLGHYMHDEHRSPYASHLYDRSKVDLEHEQTKFEKKMAKVR